MINPALSSLQRKAASKSYPSVPKCCVVTGGTGFVGIRLVQMLVERGAQKVICFDIVPKQRAMSAWNHPNIEYITGDITNYDAVKSAIYGADCVWHLAAAVGPFHPYSLYEKVNLGGTLNVIKACKQCNVKKLVFSSSPSTRFEGSLFHRPNVDGLTQEEMPALPLNSYMQMYAETKAKAQMAVRAACGDDLWAVAVAPHQVYGPRDTLFLPNVLQAAGTGKLRIFGQGRNRICFTHVDNYCHGLIVAEKQLYAHSPVIGKFYIVTDGHTHPQPGAYCIFWKEVDKAVTGMGFTSLQSKLHYPFWFLYVVALIAEFIGYLTNQTFKLNVFNVFVLTMNRWFRIEAAERQLKYQPIIAFDEGWMDTIDWFEKSWLPNFKKTNNTSIIGLSKRSQQKIDIQAHKYD